MRRPRWYRLFPIALLVLTVLVASGCCSIFNRRQTTANQVTLQLTLPQGWEAVNSEFDGTIRHQFDTDEDGELEWVVCYRFDTPENPNAAPIRCAVYDTIHRRPKLPIIFPYQLQAPGWTYLAEGDGSDLSVELADFVTTTKPDGSDMYPTFAHFAENEILVRRGQRVSIFQWRDNRPPTLRNWAPPDELLMYPGQRGASGQWYECVGMFEGSAGVYVETNKVVVKHRAGDRSQLAWVNTYRPGQPGSKLGGYLDQHDQLVPPTQSCVDFAFDVPVDIAESPYPEKVVMAFLRTYMIGPEYGSPLLTRDGESVRDRQFRDLFPRREASPLCVKTLTYSPPVHGESETQAFSLVEGQLVTGSDVRDPGVDVSATKQATPSTMPISAWVTTWIQRAPGAKEEMIQWEVTHNGTTWLINNIVRTQYVEE